MDNKIAWMNRQVRLGWVYLAVGLVFAAAGIILSRLASDLPFNERIITGFGILMLGVGLSYLLRYRVARKDVQTARRMISEERDERMQFLRARAGNRAYWVSAILSYAVLMWVSFAENGSLPPLSVDALWYFLAAVVVLPFGVYAISLSYDQQRH
jgi:ABC-type uncharacterized transport system permease subunit